MRFSKEAMEQVYTRLKRNERPLLGIISAMISVVPVCAFLILMHRIDEGTALVMYMPSIVIPLAARFTGRLYRLQSRLVVAAIATFVQLIGFAIFAVPAWFVLLLPIFFSIATYLARIYLNEIEREALLMASVGKIEE